MPKDSSESEPSAMVPATSFPKFRQLPRELQLMVWEACPEISPVRHCFNRRRFGRTYTIMDLTQNALRAAIPAKKEDPDRFLLDPYFPAWEQHKVLIKYQYYQASPTMSPAESWDAVATKWTKAQSPIYAYVNFKTDIFFLSSSTGSDENILACLRGQRRTPHNWITHAQNIALRFPPSYANLLATIDAVAWLRDLATGLRVLYIVVDLRNGCSRVPRSLWLKGAAGAVDAATGFIDFDEYWDAHHAEELRRPGPANACDCSAQEWASIQVFRAQLKAMLARRQVVIKRVVDALA